MPKQVRLVEKQMYGATVYFAGTISKAGDVLIIMTTNNPNPEKILSIYRNRWSIELMFAHCKTNRSNLEDIHLKDLKRIESLFSVVVSALALVF